MSCKSVSALKSMIEEDELCIEVDGVEMELAA